MESFCMRDAPPGRAKLNDSGFLGRRRLAERMPHEFAQPVPAARDGVHAQHQPSFKPDS
jgi:hypothetical protein